MDKQTPSVEISPFEVTVQTDKGNRFTLQFRGLDAQNHAVTVRLNFAQWWVDVLCEKLRSMGVKRAA